MSSSSSSSIPNLSNLYKDMGFPEIGKYQVDQLMLGAQWISVSAGSQDEDALDFVLKKIHPENQINKKLNVPYFKKIEQRALNFYRIFKEGFDLTKKDITPVDDLSNKHFSIQSPGDLLNANLIIRKFAEEFILRGLPSPLPNNNKQVQFSITQSNFIDPSLLSDITEEKISIEDALLLITCLGLRKGKKTFRIVDLKTGSFGKGFNQGMLISKDPHKLVFLDPNVLLKNFDRELLTSKEPHDLDFLDLSELLKNLDDPEFKTEAISENLKKETKFKDFSNIANTMFEGTKMLCLLVFNVINDFKAFIPKEKIVNFINELKKASTDHEEVLILLSKMDEYFSGVPQDQILECQKRIKKKTESYFETLNKLKNSLPNQETLDNSCKIIDARSRLLKAIEKKSHLQGIYDRYNVKIVEFLKIHSQRYELNNIFSTQIHWIIQGVDVTENFEISKTCAISRRVLCPDTSENHRKDLVYFSSKEGDESVVTRWNSLKAQKGLSDAQLAEALLSLYRGEIIDQELVHFLSFLVVLLLGKEPFFDAASHVANYILLMSVKLKLNSFEEALKVMPMIPQGAIASKQFLLHVSDKILDSTARVQYKDNKAVKPSSFLAFSGYFLGSAREWIQVYDDVATIAHDCCRQLFFKGLFPDNNHFQDFLKKIERLEGQKVGVWNISHYLYCQFLFEKRLKARNFLPDSNADSILEPIKGYVGNFLTSMGQVINNSQNILEETIKYLTKGMDPKSRLIDELIRLVDKKDADNTHYKMLRDLKVERSDPIYNDLRKVLEDWNPLERFKSQGIDPFDYSDENIKKMNNSWDSYFDAATREFDRNERFSEIGDFLKINYRIPVSYYELASHLDPEDQIDDESEYDLIGAWAVKYVLETHPLKTIQR
jgi:hypothetical protein